MTETPALTLHYQLSSGRQAAEIIRERFWLLETRPHFGGSRWWIQCTCGRRVGQVCMPRGASRFRCRRCYRLAYDSQNETSEWRAFRRVQKLTARLSAEEARDLVPADLWDSWFPPDKPKWMRWATYDAIVRRAETYAEYSTARAVDTMTRILARAR